MKIDNLPGPNAPKTVDTRSTQGTQSGSDGSGSRGVKSTQDDSVTLTDTARRLGELKNQLADGSVVDSGRVERTRQAVHDGSYQIDPTRLANKLFQFEVN